MLDTAQDSAEKEVSFEQALQELEVLVQKMEAGQVPLEEAVALYERGVSLKKICAKKLEEARLRVEKITLDESGAPVGVEPFEDSI